MASKPPLHPELFANALRQHAHIAVRSEQMEKLTPFFVDNNQLGLLKNPDWQVIYGRRGTGKTLLLGVLNEEIQERFLIDRFLSVRISIQDCLVSPKDKSISDHIRALGYFQTFLENLVRALVKRVDDFLGEPTLRQRVSGSRKRVLSKVEDLSIELLQLSQTGIPVGAFVSRYQETDSTSSSSEQTITDAGGGIEVSLKSADARATLSGSAAATSKNEDTVKIHEDTPEVPRFALVRAKLIELLQLMEIRHLNILIDEWPVLDPHAVTGIQPEFAEYLKRTFSGVKEIAVKIATNRYQTRFNNKGSVGLYRGLEINADIFEASNLDRSLETPAQQRQFFTNLLFKRLVNCEPGLQQFDSDGDGIPDEQFVLSLFRDMRTFDELIKGSSAIPRNFLLILKTLAKESNFKCNPTWHSNLVHRAIKENLADLEDEIDPNSEADQLLGKCVKPIVESTGSRIFLIDKDERVSSNTAIEELLQKRLIEQYSRSELSAEVTNKFDAFLLHFGLWLSWRGMPDAKLESGYTEVPKITSKNANKHKLDLSLIDTNILTCPHCTDRFPETSRSYQVAKLCPQCFKLVS